MTTDEWKGILSFLQEFGLEVVVDDRLAGRIVLQVPHLQGESQ